MFALQHDSLATGMILGEDVPDSQQLLAQPVRTAGVFPTLLLQHEGALARLASSQSFVFSERDLELFFSVLSVQHCFTLLLQQLSLEKVCLSENDGFSDTFFLQQEELPPPLPLQQPSVAEDFMMHTFRLVLVSNLSLERKEFSFRAIAQWFPCLFT